LTDICELRAGAISVPWEERQVIEENDNGHERRKEKAQMVFCAWNCVSVVSCALEHGSPPSVSSYGSQTKPSRICGHRRSMREV
jgi:hypothetical protein